MNSNDIFKKNFIFDFKSLGINAFFPIIISFISIIFIIGHLNEDHIIISVINISETFIPMTAGWISIFLFYDLLEKGGNEVIFTYPVKRSSLGIKRVLTFFFVYAISIVFYLLIVQSLIKQEIFLSLYIQLLVEGVFFCALGFLIMSLTSNSGISIVILVIYNIVSILTAKKYFGFLNVFYFNAQLLNFKDIFLVGIKPILYSIVLFTIGQWNFNKVMKR